MFSTPSVPVSEDIVAMFELSMASFARYEACEAVQALVL